MLTEYYAPKARAEAEAVEAIIWSIVQSLYADNTVKWSNLLEHPNTGKFGVVLPVNWRDLGIDIAEVDILTHEDMETAGWFPVETLEA